MKMPAYQFGTMFVGAYALLVACNDLNLADKVQDSSVGTGGGGTSGTGGAARTGGAASHAGAATVAGMSSQGGAANAGGASSLGGAPTGGNPATGGSSPATLASGGAIPFGGTSSTSVTISSGAPNSGGHPSSGGNSASGGTSSTRFASGGTAPLGGTTSLGGSNKGDGGGASSAGAPTTGGNAATGGAPLALGGQSSAALLSGGTVGTGGTTAMAGAPGSGGIAGAGGAAGAGAGGASSSSDMGQGGVLASGGTTAGATLRQDALNWQPCLSDLNQYVTSIARSPQSLTNMLVGCSNGDVYLTFDGLSTNPNPHWIRVDDWTTIGGAQLGLPGGSVNAIAYSPTDVNTAYIAFAGSKQGRKLWKTTTNGTFWEELTSCPLSEVWSVSVNPLDPQKVYLFGPGGAFMSPDGGDTWTADVTSAPMNVPIAAGAKLSTVSVAPGQPDVIWVGATNGDVFFTTSATSNQTWYQPTKYMPTRAVTHVALDTLHTPIGVLVTFDGMGTDSIWATYNNGTSWIMLQNDALPVRTIVPGVYAFYGVSINPIDSSVLYIDGTYGVGVSTNAGSSWTWTDAL